MRFAVVMVVIAVHLGAAVSAEAQRSNPPDTGDQGYESADGFAAVTATGLRVRSGPAIDSDVIASLRAGTLVRTRSRTVQRDTVGDLEAYWYQVEVVGQANRLMGWCFGWYLAAIGNEEEAREAAELIESRFHRDGLPQMGPEGKVTYGPPYRGQGWYVTLMENGLVAVTSSRAGVLGYGSWSPVSPSTLRIELTRQGRARLSQYFNPEGVWVQERASENVLSKFALRGPKDLLMFDLTNVWDPGERVEIHGVIAERVEAFPQAVREVVQPVSRPDGPPAGEFRFQGGVTSTYLPAKIKVTVLAQATDSGYSFVTFDLDERISGPRAGFIRTSALAQFPLEWLREETNMLGFAATVLRIEGNPNSPAVNATTGTRFAVEIEQRLETLARSATQEADLRSSSAISRQYASDDLEFAMHHYGGDPFLGRLSARSLPFALPYGITFGQSDEAARRLLGEPQRQDSGARTGSADWHRIGYQAADGFVFLEFERNSLSRLVYERTF